MTTLTPPAFTVTIPVVTSADSIPEAAYLAAGVLTSQKLTRADFAATYGPNWETLAMFMSKVAAYDLDASQSVAAADPAVAPAPFVSGAELNSARDGLFLAVEDTSVKRSVEAATTSVCALADAALNWMPQPYRQPMVDRIADAAAVIVVDGIIPADHPNFGATEVDNLNEYAQSLGFLTD